MSDKPDNVKLIPIDRCRDWEANPNEMSPEDMDLLRHGMSEAGFLQPILVWARPDDWYDMVDGHHRKDCAKALGYVDVPAHVLPEDFPPEKVDALRLALNRLRGQSSTTAVARHIQRMTEDYPSLDMTLTGYSQQVVDSLLESLSCDDLDDILDEVGSAVITQDDDDKPAKAFTLELSFQTAEELKQVKRVLKKAAGRGNDIAHGVLVLAGVA